MGHHNLTKAVKCIALLIGKPYTVWHIGSDPFQNVSVSGSDKINGIYGNDMVILFMFDTVNGKFLKLTQSVRGNSQHTQNKIR